eukprot:TRINITY_DN16279_c0_g1_i1.p1 TRINITY_DN16279_c0_g1~~TRINITY_DN16279_c0_g1_i1.p1  ORF type:complete len:253 (-),score=68.74 TRINITY_DN16279_c0_g1_i1:70-828(-)
MGGKSSTLKERGDLANKTTSLAVGELDLDAEDFQKALKHCKVTLRSVEANHNSIKSLPPSLAQYSNLKQVNFANNKLSLLPAQVFGALMNLEKLNLESNSITALPDLAPLVKLKELHASHNIIDAFPSHLPPKLQELVLADNRICSLPEGSLWKEAARLAGLDVSDNRLDALPESLGEAPVIRSLKAANNNLKDIPVLILRDTKIDVLSLQGNQFDQRQFSEFEGAAEYCERRKARCDKSMSAHVDFGRDIF